MKKKLKISPFECGSFLWILTAFFALILAILGIFHLELILVWLVILASGLIILAKKRKLAFSRTEKIDIYMLAGLIVLGVFLSLLTTPTIFGGRDEGAMANAAIYIARDHGLKHQDAVVDEFFGIYGPGKALNFPGFYYTQGGSLRSQFLPGYPAWVAVWYSLFGIGGIAFANFFPLVTFLFSLFLIAKKLAKGSSFAVFATILFALFLPTTLFFKFTLSEIFYGALVWFSLYLLLNYFQHKDRFYFLLLFVPLALAPFVRIESLGIIFMLALLLIGLDHKHLRLPRYQLLFVLLALAMFTSLFVNARFFVDTFRNFATISPVESLRTGEVSPVSIIPDDWKGWYMLKIFYTYSIIPLFVMAAAYVVMHIKKRKWFRLVPFFFFAPALVYVVDANISLDHPWMLRRFTFAVVPLLVLYSALLLEATSFVFKRVAWAIAAIMLVLFSSISLPLLHRSQNKDLLAQVAELSAKFGPQDLVLVSQKASGDGWSLLADPLRTVYGKQAVYFFNPADFGKLDTSKFGSVYLVSSDAELGHYAELGATEVSSYSLSHHIVRPSYDPLQRPAMIELETSGKIMLLGE